VSNTVARCMAVAGSFPSASAYVYHSRFRYRDRVERHGAVIAAFRDPGGTVAATTQVAEISLDLSADLLVTDLAPVPAMIQRLGRLNRRSTPDAPTPPAPCVVLPFAGVPYEAHELADARAWVRRLHGRPLSQRDLVAAWTQPPQAPPAPGGSAWLDGLFHTEPVRVRDASPGVTVLLESDAAAVRARQLRAEEAALPMPPPARVIDVRGWPRVAYLPVAPQALISYNPMRGAEWRNA
jgi:CRISPR-associated endonuclease/helicase Cas3